MKNNIKQIIFVTESDIDYGYIRNTIIGFYDISNIRLDKIFAGGKNKLLDNKIKAKIKCKMKGFEDKEGISKVVFCYDTDDLSILKEHDEFDKKIKRYCDANGYEYIWFDRTIEEVFLNHIVIEDKRNEMIKYINNNDKDFNIIKKSGVRSKTNSNIIIVLDKLLNRKDDR